MVIPGTKGVDTTGVTAGNTGNELFYFCISDTEDSGYLERFIEQLDAHIPSFVFSKDTLANYERLLAEGKTSKSPLEHARHLLQKTRAGGTAGSGELGELLMFLFAKNVKGANKLVSKIQSRTSTTTTQQGRDGSFILQDERGEIYMLLGEAKMHQDSNDGLREAQTDMNAFWGDQERLSHEIRLASSHLRDELTPQNTAAYEAYFIDDNPRHQELKYKSVVFVGFNFPAFSALIQKTADFNAFSQEVLADLNRCFNNQAAHITASPHPNIYCFVPFESVESARTAFASRHSLTH